jgi:phosphoglycerol transferase MdoB-like AlkP superfamily enzyme
MARPSLFFPSREILSLFLSAFLYFVHPFSLMFIGIETDCVNLFYLCRLRTIPSLENSLDVFFLYHMKNGETTSSVPSREITLSLFLISALLCYTASLFYGDRLFARRRNHIISDPDATANSERGCGVRAGSEAPKVPRGRGLRRLNRDL